MSDRITDRIATRISDSVIRLDTPNPTDVRTYGHTKKVLTLREISCESNARKIGNDSVVVGGNLIATHYAVTS